MTWSRHVRVALTPLCLFACAARQAGAQRLDELPAGARLTLVPARAAAPVVAAAPALWPSPQKLTLLSLAGSVSLAYSGALLGVGADKTACERRHRDDPPDQFYFVDPCSPSFDRGTSVGWLGGAVVGSSFVSAALAQRRGCPVRVAAWRALGGALAGATPGVVAALGAHHRYPPGRATVIVTGPLLTGAGAALAVVGCHR